MISQRRVAPQQSSTNEALTAGGGNSNQQPRKQRRASSLVLVVVTIVAVAAIARDGPTSKSEQQETAKQKQIISASALQTIENRASDPTLLMKLFTNDEAEANSQPIQEWRKRYMTACQKNDTQAYLKTQMDALFAPPSDEIMSTLNQTETETKSHDQMVEPCQYTFLDLGANIGDTVSHVVDASLPFCGDAEYTALHQRYIVTQGLMAEAYRKYKWNQLSSWLNQRLTNSTIPTSKPIYPEDMCIFSFEGNPTFTTRLKDLEQRVMATVPRPVRRTYFFTESVVTATPGPTTLYLDTVNAKGNFDGSSLISDMFSIEKVKKQNEGKVQEAKVMGYNLEQILKMTVIPAPNSRVIIKMDIEGVEYEVINDGAQYLCDLVKTHGVYVAMVAELHEKKRVNVHTRRYHKETVPMLRSCGVDFNKGDGG